MGKTVSQKKFIKGLNAGTGVLTEPPGTITRVSNLIFTARGSLQTTDGSAIIGQITGANAISRAMGTFSNFASGQFPYYPTITSPAGFSIPDVKPFTVIFTYGVASNPAGPYTFAVVASNLSGSVHSSYVASVTTTTANAAWGTISISWTIVPGNYYTLYYLPGGPTATSGVVLAGPTLNNSGFTGTPTYVLPTSPLVTLPNPNNSYTYSLSVGNIVPPSKQVFFSPTGISIPAFPPQPAALAPGDPQFQFQTSFSTSASYNTTGTSASTVQTSSGSTTQTSSNTAAFPSVALSSSQTILVNLNITYTLSAFAPSGSGFSQAIFQSSVDGGITWQAFQEFEQSGSNYSVTQTSNVPVTINGATNLSNVLFRVIVNTAGGGTGSLNFSASGSINFASVTLTTINTFTPYGGIANTACPIPQILQFNQKSILILGNGYAPQSTDPSLLSSATLTALSNTFTAAFPAWQASVAWNTGDSIAVLISGTNYQFTAQQPGVSGTSTPAFSSTLGSTVADGQVVWKNVGAITTSVSPRGAAHGIVYAGSLWLYNTSPSTTGDQLDGPTCLKMSDSNNQNSWNPANIAFIGKDDGTQGTGLASFTVAEVGIAPTGSLVAFKEFSTYQILGVFGSTDFQIVQAQTNLGCIAARSIQFLPGYGIVRLTHMGFAIFNGVNDTLISEEIRPYIFGGTGASVDLTGIDFSFCYLSQGSQSSSPPMYMCACPLLSASGALTRLFVYDMVLKAWTILDLPWPVTTVIQAITGEGKPLTIAAKADGSGAVERLFTSDPSWDASSLVAALTASQTPIVWHFKTPHVFREGSSLRQFYRKVVFRGYSSQATAQMVTVMVEVNGIPITSYPVRIQPQPTSKQFELQVDLMLTAQNVQIRILGQGVLTMDGVDWDVTEKVGGTIMVG